MTPNRHLRAIRLWSTIFIVGLVLSGVTAFPLVHETGWLVRIAAALHLNTSAPALFLWLERVADALAVTSARYPFLAYGTDWLAFGHLVIALFICGLYRDPVRNRWLVDASLIACVAVLLLAFIAGPVRQIPLYWRLIDSSFGVFGAVPLLLVRRHIDALEGSGLATPIS